MTKDAMNTEQPGLEDVLESDKEALTRRTLVVGSGALLVGSMVACRQKPIAAAVKEAPSAAVPQQEALELRDWSGFTDYGPGQVQAPRSEQEVVALVKSCIQGRKKLRPMGLRTAWNTYWYNQDVIMSMLHLNQIVNIDRENRTITCQPGVTLETLHNEAWKNGMTLSTAPAPGWVTAGGAVATGSHGSVMAGSISSSLIACRLVNGQGEVMEIGPNHELMDAVRISAGMLGVMTQLTFKLDMAFKLSLAQSMLPSKDWRRYLNEGEMSFLQMFPARGESLLWQVTAVDEPASPDDRTANTTGPDGLLKLLGPAHQVVMGYQPPTPTIAGGEWAVPESRFDDVLRDFEVATKEGKLNLPQMIWLKKVKGETAWLAAADNDGNKYVQCGIYHPVLEGAALPAGKQSIVTDMVKAVEEIMVRHGGRPHLGKLISMTPEMMHKVYPNLERFHKVRKQLDPNDIFYTRNLAAVFG